MLGRGRDGVSGYWNDLSCFERPTNCFAAERRVIARPKPFQKTVKHHKTRSCRSSRAKLKMMDDLFDRPPRVCHTAGQSCHGPLQSNLRVLRNQIGLRARYSVFSFHAVSGTVASLQQRPDERSSSLGFDGDLPHKSGYGRAGKPPTTNHWQLLQTLCWVGMRWK
jgi:hypothetical protein